MIQKAKSQSKNEIVMTPGMTIRATNATGTILIAATDALTRSYTWEGATRSVEMTPREKRWDGSLGLYYPGLGDHWKEHHGITRGVLEEGQQHFKTLKEALAWIRSRTWMPYVYTESGLVVGWNKTLPRRQLNVEVWQLYIGGKKPQNFLGSQNQKVIVTKAPAASVFSSLTSAVQASHLVAVTTLLRNGANPNTRDGAGRVLLSVAANHGSTEIVQALLQKGANPNGRNEDGSTVLLGAIDNEQLTIVKLLIAKGANVNAVAESGEMKGSSALLLAALGDNAPLVELLLQAGADVKATDDQLHNTPLAWACSSGNVAIAKLLLAKGAEVDARNSMGGTPLMGAAMAGNPELVKLLIAKGAKVTARDDQTRQVYGQALFMGDTRAAEQIRKSGKLNELQEDGRSVLDWAGIGGNSEVITILKQAGAVK